MTHPRRDVDCGDVILSGVAHRLVSQEHKAFGGVRGHPGAVIRHAHVCLIPVLPGQKKTAGIMYKSKKKIYCPTVS